MLLKDWPRLRESRNGADEMFWEVNRGGALTLPGAQGLVFMAPVIPWPACGVVVPGRRPMDSPSSQMHKILPTGARVSDQSHFGSRQKARANLMLEASNRIAGLLAQCDPRRARNSESDLG